MTDSPNNDKLIYEQVLKKLESCMKAPAESVAADSPVESTIRDDRLNLSVTLKQKRR